MARNDRNNFRHINPFCLVNVYHSEVSDKSLECEDCPFRDTCTDFEVAKRFLIVDRRQTNEKKQTNPQDEDQKMGGGTGPGNAVPSA